MSEAYPVESLAAVPAPLEKEKPSLDGANRELLASTEAGQLLLPMYEAAVKTDPRLEGVRLVAIDPNEESKIGFARNGFEQEDKTHEVHMQFGPEGYQAAEEVLSEHGFSAKVIAGRLGLRQEDITPELLLKFAFLHELGHTVDYINHEGNSQKYYEETSAAFLRLPIGKATPRYLRSEEGRRFVDEHWEGIKKHLKVKTFEELLEKQSKAYRKMPHEAFADSFAARILRREVVKQRVVKKLMARVLSFSP